MELKLNQKEVSYGNDVTFTFSDQKEDKKEIE